MQILRDRSDLNALPDGLVRSLLAQRFVELAQDEPCDPDLPGFFVVVEANDAIAEIEQACGCTVFGNRYSAARFGDADFLPGWECLEYHAGSDGSPGCFEMVLVHSDDGFGVILVTPDQDGISPALLALCRTYARPASAPTAR